MDYPDDLPCVSRIDGFQFKASSSVIRTPFEAGNSRLRRIHKRMPTDISLTWRIPNDKLHPLFVWLNTYGYDWFNLNLAGIEASQSNVMSKIISVRLMGDLQKTLLRVHYQNWWLVSASAEYRPGVVVLTPSGEGDWIIGGTPAAPSGEWVIGGTPAAPSPDFTNPGTPNFPSANI